MTCKEARRLLDWSAGRGGPYALTVAERQSVSRHVVNCKSCSRYVEKKAATARKRTPVSPEDETIIAKEMLALHLADLSDPEAM